MRRALLLTAMALLSCVPASAKPKAAKPLTPFEGAWAPPGESADCENAGITGDGFTIENNVIGAGDTMCTIRQVERRGETFFLRLHCHGLNRSMAGTHHARIDRLAKTHIRFNFGGKPTEYRSCPRP